MKINLVKIDKEHSSATFFPSKYKEFKFMANKLMIVEPKENEFDLFCKALSFPHTVKCKPDGTVTIRFTMESKFAKVQTRFDDRPEEDFTFFPKNEEDFDIFEKSFMIAVRHDGKMQRQIAFSCLIDSEDIPNCEYEGGKVSDR